MAGPWEEYKTPDVTVTKIGDREIAPASNTGPWSEYQTKFPESEIPARRTWKEVGQEAITNVLPSGQKFAAGLYQAITSPVETLSGLGEVLTGAYARFIPQEWMARPDKAQEFIQKANAFGGAYKDRYGSVEALKNTIATDPVGFLADVSTLTGAGGMVAPGRAGQVATTVSRYTDPLRISGVLPILEKGGDIATRAGGAALRGAKTNVLLEAIEGRGPQIINALRNQPEIVPGARPTAGEAAVPAGGTRFAALQESAEKVLPSEYRARQLEQDAARAAAVRQIGKTETELAAAVKARKDEAQLLYGAAGIKPVVEDATLKSLRTRPSMKRAFERAKELAAEEGTTLGSSGNYTAADMHYVKLALDDFTKDPATFGIGKVEASKIGKTKEEFISWLERQVPEYGTARSAFQTRSKPINQMEVGQYLESRLTSALEGEQKLRPGAFATAVEAAPQTIKRATTGGARFEKLSDVLTPDQVKIVEDVRKDLARQSEFRKQAAAARQAGPEAGGAASQTLIEVAGGAQFPTLLNRVTTIANALMKRMAGKIDRKVAIEIATDMLDPERTALAIEAAQRRAGVVSAFGQPIRAAGRGAARIATPVATTTNALTESQNRNALRPQ